MIQMIVQPFPYYISAKIFFKCQTIPFLIIFYKTDLLIRLTLIQFLIMIKPDKTPKNGGSLRSQPAGDTTPTPIWRPLLLL